MTVTVIPPNVLRKKSRALIDNAWAAGNRKADKNGVEAGPKPAASDLRAGIDKKIEETAQRRIRRRALKI